MRSLSKSARPYSAADEAYILDNWRSMSDEDMGAAIGRSEDAISRKRAQMGIVRSRALVVPPEIAEKVAEMYPNHTAAYIAEALGVNQRMVTAARLKLGIRKHSKKKARKLAILANEWSRPAYPKKPLGFSAEQLDWAWENNGIHPEAGLILTMAKDRGVVA